MSRYDLTDFEWRVIEPLLLIPFPSRGTACTHQVIVSRSVV